MSHQSGTGRRRGTFALASVAALALAGLAGTTSYAAGGGPHGPTSPRASVPHLDRGFYDVRTTGARAQASLLRTAQRTAGRPTARTFRVAPVDQTVTDIDANTGTVRMRARLDGFLTGASTRAPGKIALGYVQANHSDLGLTPSDLDTFHLARDYRDITGAHHLYYTQRINGHPVIGNGLTATVTKAGHLLTVGGSPVSQAALRIAPVTSSSALPTARRRAGRGAGRDRTRHGPEPGRRDQRPVRRRPDRTPGVPGHRDVVGEPRHGRARREHRQGAAAPPAGQLREQHRPRLPLLPGRSRGWQAGEGELHQAPLAQRLRQDPERQQLPHLLRRERQQPGVAERGGAREERALLGLPAHALPPAVRQVVLRQAVALLVEPEQARTPGRPTAPRTPPRSSSSSTPGTTTCRRRRSASPRRRATSSGSTTASAARTATRSTRRPTTVPTPTTACPTAPTSTTPTWVRRPTAAARRCRCTCSTSRSRRTRAATRSPRPTWATRPTRSTTSTPTACPTDWSSTCRVAPRSVASRPARWARPGATGTPWTTWCDQHLQRDRAAEGRRPPLRLRRQGRRLRPHRADRLQGRPDHGRALQGRRHRSPRRLHLRRLRPRRRLPRGPRRRRDLGPDPVEPARRPRLATGPRRW